MPWQHHGSTSYQDPRQPKPIILTMILMVPLMAACQMNIDHDASEEEPISFRRDFGPPFDLGFRPRTPDGMPPRTPWDSAVGHEPDGSTLRVDDMGTPNPVIPPDSGIPASDLDPNRLDPAALFQCNGTPGSSPARLRRLERMEWTHNVNKSTEPSNDGSVARNNPFDAPGHLPFSTYSRDVSIDAVSLDLYLGILEQESSGWTGRYRRNRPAFRRLNLVVDDRDLRCMLNDAAPADDCIDYYLTTLLERGVLYRPPTAAELRQIKTFAVATLSQETDPEAQRQDSLYHIISAAWTMSGALFRSELGQGAPDANGRYRLSDWELALNLAYTLSDRAPGVVGSHAHDQGPPEHAHYTAPMAGYLAEIVSAARDGTIQEPATLARLVRTYAGGVDPARVDLMQEFRIRNRERRGQYWTASKITRFFRQWLGYGDISTAFKDTPEATSAFEDDGRQIARSYYNQLGGYYGDEPLLTEQLDDTIARIIVEDVDVLTELLTTRRFYVASNTAYANASFNTNTNDVHRLYNLDQDVPATQAGRWVDMPATERAGVLTHPAWLTAHGGNFEDDASIIHRGKWIREKLFCQTVPPLELVMVEAMLIPSSPERSARQRVAESVENNPECMGCHSMMNSLGRPFEFYNHAGFLRAEDHGAPPDGSTVVDNLPDPTLNRAYSSPIEMSTAFAQSESVKQCFVRQAFRFFMGRDETLADACTLTAMQIAYDESGGSFVAMIEELVMSDTFAYRVRNQEER